MNQTTQVLLTPPDDLAEAAAFPLPLAHMAYKIGPDGHLQQAAFPRTPPRSGLLLTSWEGPDQGDPRVPARELISVCAAHNFSGIVLDLEQPPTPYLARVIALTEEFTAQRNWSLYLPESYGRYSSRARIFFSSALSGGSLRRRMEETIAQYGANRLVLCLRRSAEDFFLPAPNGSGRPLTQQELHSQMERLEPSVFFSQELCTHYFTYMSRDSGAHIVLFDTGESLKKKRELAEELGIRRFFLLYPELADLLPTLVPTPTTAHS